MLVFCGQIYDVISYRVVLGINSVTVHISTIINH